jgi:hypothetical protein
MPLRRGLHEEIALLAAHADEVLSRWAAVMLNADVYAEVIDRHVELASDISWLLGLLDKRRPTPGPPSPSPGGEQPRRADRGR